MNMPMIRSLIILFLIVLLDPFKIQQRVGIIGGPRITAHDTLFATLRYCIPLYTHLQELQIPKSVITKSVRNPYTQKRMSLDK